MAKLTDAERELLTPPPWVDQKLRDLGHAVQSGVALMMQAGSVQTEPKHMRVGINSAIISTSALARLLMLKGVITPEEYWAQLIQVWEEEVEAYTSDVRAAYNNLGIILA